MMMKKLLFKNKSDKLMKFLYFKKQGLDTGFGEEDSYTVYDKPWRETESMANTIYRPSKNVDKEYGDDFEKALSSKRFVPDKGFEGADSKGGAAGGSREGPVVFEQHHDTNFDPFQIDDFLGNLKTGGSSSNKREQEDDSYKNKSSSSDNKKKRK